MTRLLGFCPPRYTQHVIRRRNNRGPCFGDDVASQQHMEWLTEFAQEFAVAVHAWVLMGNHVHLLATPTSNAPSRFAGHVNDEDSLRDSALERPCRGYGTIQ